MCHTERNNSLQLIYDHLNDKDYAFTLVDIQKIGNIESEGNFLESCNSQKSTKFSHWMTQFL